MVEVVLWASLRRFADGKQVVKVEAHTVDGILKGLVALYPALKPHLLERGVSVSVNGNIVASGSKVPISPDSEVVLMQRIRGG